MSDVRVVVIEARCKACGARVPLRIEGDAMSPAEILAALEREIDATGHSKICPSPPPQEARHE